MTVNPDEVRKRWSYIREQPECDLALTPASVRKYLEKPEADLVADRIQESLVQLAAYRVKVFGFRSRQPSGSGDLATGEGLEAFLVPAVEGALEFSSVLQAISLDKDRNDFVKAILSDIGDVLSHWENGQFSGKPYAEEDDILEALNAKFKAKLDVLNITEAAAMACRVLIHLLTLKNLPSPKEDLFNKEIGSHLDQKKMLQALQRALEFLVQSFQKSKTGADDEERIAESRMGEDLGSGWSWTDWQGLPPMLFFTAAAVDAFAELDLYLIRPAEKGQWPKEGEGLGALQQFYDKNKTTITLFQLCVDMARKWVQSSVLPDLSLGGGQHEESEVEYLKEESADRMKPYKLELERAGVNYPPVLYNSLYGLQILLWSWGDWTDWIATSGQEKERVEIDTQTKRWINQALAQLVYSYDSVPAVKEVLRKVDHEFLLPGKGFYSTPELGGNEEERKAREEEKRKREEKCRYLDAGFLPSLTRLLVLFLVYGVGDRNLLEPVIRDLYVELLQNRNRTSKDFGMLWSADGVEIFSTQRATQALTFYWAYASGKQSTSNSETSANLDGLVLLRNNTKHRLSLEMFDDDARPAAPVMAEPPAPVTVEVPVPNWVHVETFAQYMNDYLPKLIKDAAVEGDDGIFRGEVNDLGAKILRAVNMVPPKDYESARIILNSVAQIYAKPKLGTGLRRAEFKMLKRQYDDLMADEAAEDDT